jgi:mRNA interferase HicA
VKTRQFKKWLKSKGVICKEGRGHTKLYFKDRRSTLPRHTDEINEGLRKGIIKQLGLSYP